MSTKFGTRLDLASEFKALTSVAVVAFIGSILTLAFYLSFELVTENAFGLLQGTMRLPVVATVPTDLVLTFGFWVCYCLTIFAGTLRLPTTALSGKLLSTMIWCYVILLGVALISVFRLLPDTLYKQARFLGLAAPLLLNPATMLVFLFTPLPILLIIYRWRKLGLTGLADLGLLALGVLAWMGCAFLIINLR